MPTNKATIARSAPRAALLQDALISLVLCALCLAAYGRVCHFGFVPFDDPIEITGNLHLHGLTLANLQWMFADTSQSQRYTPLSWLVWAMLRQFFGLDPTAFHAEALLVHLINTLLVLALIGSVLERSLSRPISHRARSLCAGIGAALWSLHPLRIEVVSWVTQVRFGEAACFALLAVLLYFRAVDRAPHSPSRSGWFAGSALSFLVSLLFYPSAIGLPLLLPFLDVYPLRRISPRTASLRDAFLLLREKLLFFIPALFVGGMTVYGRLATTWGVAAGLGKFSWLSRLMQAAYVITYYLWKPFAALSVSPVYTQLTEFNPLAAPFVASLILVVLLGLAAALCFRRRPQLTVLGVAHLALILPVGGYFEHPYYPADRYSYLQGILWSIALAACLAWLWEKARPIARAAALVSVLAILSLATLARAEVEFWRDGESLFHHIISTLGDDPYRADIYPRLGGVLLQEGRLAEAVEAFDRALAISPHRLDALQGRAASLLRLAQSVSSQRLAPAQLRAAFVEAAKAFDALIEVQPTVRNLASAGAAYGEAGMLPAAKDRLGRALALAPRDGNLHFNDAQVLFASGEVAEAKAELELAVALAPALRLDRDRLLAVWAAAPPRSR